MITSAPELAAKYKIKDDFCLMLFLLYAGQAAGKWDQAPVGDDSLDELAHHIERINALLKDKHNWAALTAGRAHADRYLEDILQGPLSDLRKMAQSSHRPKKRGTKPKNLARSVVAWCEQYWSTHLKREFTSDWHAGQPVSEAAQFAYDVMMMFAPQDIGSLQRAMIEKVAALRV